MTPNESAWSSLRKLDDFDPPQIDSMLSGLILLYLVEKAPSLTSENNERQFFRNSSGEGIITTTKTAAFSDAYFNKLTFLNIYPYIHVRKSGIKMRCKNTLSSING